MMPTYAVELDVVEVVLLGLGLERVGGRLVLELGVVGVPERRVVVQGDLAVERDDAAVLGPDQRVDLDERRVLLAVHRPQLLQDVGDLGCDVPSKPAAATISAALAASMPTAGPRRRGPAPPAARRRAARSPRRPRRWPWPGSAARRGRAAARSSTPRRSTRPAATMTRCTVWPLMSMPRISAGRAPRSPRGECASLTPPALPRPPVLTWALTTTVPPPSRSAATRASSGVVATTPPSTGTPCLSKRSRAWYSNRSTLTPFVRRAAVNAALCRRSDGSRPQESFLDVERPSSRGADPDQRGPARTSSVRTVSGRPAGSLSAPKEERG